MDEHLKDRLAFMGSLASGLAHEIKNPLSTMTITLGLLREDFEDAETTRDQRTLRKIQLLDLEVTRLEHIVQDFLSFAGGHAVRPQLVDVNGWLSELLDFFEPSCAEGDVRLERILGEGLPEILADPELLKQAILNLLANALQAMPEGGFLTVRTWFRGDRVRIDVRDTGVGIPRDELSRMWQVYYSTKDTGSGLGLPTVRRIIAEHGGDVNVESRPGHGTTFSILLPLPRALGSEEPLRLPGSPVLEERDLPAIIAGADATELSDESTIDAATADRARENAGPAGEKERP
jgi:two-component system sensor histidine kinase HydH